MKFLVADAQPRTRSSMKALLLTCSSVDWVQEAANCEQALHCLEASLPDVVLVDAGLPDMNGLELTRIAKARWPQVKVMVLSLYPECSAAAQAVGADAFVGKGEPPERLLAALEEMVGGQARC